MQSNFNNASLNRMVRHIAAATAFAALAGCAHRPVMPPEACKDVTSFRILWFGFSRITHDEKCADFELKKAGNKAAIELMKVMLSDSDITKFGTGVALAMTLSPDMRRELAKAMGGTPLATPDKIARLITSTDEHLQTTGKDAYKIANDEEKKLIDQAVEKIQNPCERVVTQGPTGPRVSLFCPNEYTKINPM